MIISDLFKRMQDLLRLEKLTPLWIFALSRETRDDFPSVLLQVLFHYLMAGKTKPTLVTKSHLQVAAFAHLTPQVSRTTLVVLTCFLKAAQFLPPLQVNCRVSVRFGSG